MAMTQAQIPKRGYEGPPASSVTQDARRWLARACARPHETTRRKTGRWTLHRQAHSRLAGQSLLEFALLLAVGMMILSVLIDAGRLAVMYQGMVEAAREGAVYGSVSAGSNDVIIDRAIQSEPALHLNADDVTITYTGAACADGSSRIAVAVSKHVPLIAPLTSAMFPGGVTLTTSQSALIIKPICP